MAVKTSRAASSRASRDCPSMETAWAAFFAEVFAKIDLIRQREADSVQSQQSVTVTIAASPLKESAQ